MPICLNSLSKVCNSCAEAKNCKIWWSLDAAANSCFMKLAVPFPHDVLDDAVIVPQLQELVGVVSDCEVPTWSAFVLVCQSNIREYVHGTNLLQSSDTWGCRMFWLLFCKGSIRHFDQVISWQEDTPCHKNCRCHQNHFHLIHEDFWNTILQSHVQFHPFLQFNTMRNSFWRLHCQVTFTEYLQVFCLKTPCHFGFGILQAQHPIPTSAMHAMHSMSFLWP